MNYLLDGGLTWVYTDVLNATSSVVKMNKILLATLLMLMATLCGAESPYWVKTHDPMKLVDWVRHDKDFIARVCGTLEPQLGKVDGCVIRSGSEFAAAYGSPHGAVIVSVFSEKTARRMTSCDGLSLYDHEVHHVISGEDHYGKCPKASHNTSGQ